MVEEERDRFMTKLLNEEKSRKSLEGTFKEEDIEPFPLNAFVPATLNTPFISL